MAKHVVPEVLDDTVEAIEVAHDLDIRVPSNTANYQNGLRAGSYQNKIHTVESRAASRAYARWRTV